MKLWTRKDIKTLLDGRPERYGIVYLWFGVSLVYKSSAPLDEQGTHLFEEQIIVLNAADAREAGISL
jgi:hypothetical protein